PSPSLPNAPSKSDLALQGLDDALVDAEFVDPGTSMPITLPPPPLSSSRKNKHGQEDDGGAEEDACETGLSVKMRRRLKELGITELFAVQTRLLPFLLPRDARKRGLYAPYAPPRDVCVSAPTGSGKTLAYVLPIVETLSSRIITRLRALVVLPTRDLVMQVRETFEEVGKGRGLKVGTATGQHSFAHEQSQLIADRSSGKIDILICTPGRLVDHMNGTPNFSLQHLRFLVIDEADRLLAQSFQDWVARVVTATRPTTFPSSGTPRAEEEETFGCADGLAPPLLHAKYAIANTYGYMDEKPSSSCQKLLFSATLPRDPGKLAGLQLRDVKYFVVQKARGGREEGVLDVVMERYTMPATLREHMIVCASSEKPLVLFDLVQRHKVRNGLVFTKSAESTARLVRLFELFEKAVAGEGRLGVVAKAYSSDLSVGERRGILEKFKAEEIQILVCSDLISRGMDMSHVSHVVSYDVPVDMRKYVHRVGRTARAGREGDAWTLVEEQEVSAVTKCDRAGSH
ncbi:hypothetical protein SERLA73DRAFT_54272, partial [Serpula lacrymans var. lacrymans S7.3]